MSKVVEIKTIEYDVGGLVSVETVTSFDSFNTNTVTKTYQYDVAGRFIGHQITESIVHDKDGFEKYLRDCYESEPKKANSN